MPETVKSIDQKENFRTRVAREKRERMRELLLEAALDVYHPEEKKQAVVIDDIIKKAGVSRGSFYKYFQSLEQLSQQLGKKLADEMIVSYQKLFSNSDKELVKITGGTVITLARAAMDPRWGVFTSNIDFIEHLSESNPLFSIITDALEKARDEKILQFNSIEVASDMLTGATVGATKRLAHGEKHPKAYIVEMTRICMAGLGMSSENAERGIQEAWEVLENSTDQLYWWKSLDTQQP
ncbi:MAG: TetR/AcrR family transcriptional regulator [Spongiibacteraceae bacterium]